MAMDDPPRLLGMAMVGFFCVRCLPRVSVPVTLWCLGGFYVGCFAIQVLLCVYRASTPWDGILHVLWESMVIVTSLPAVAAVMAGRAPSGRLLWFLGWQLLWLAHMIIMPMQDGLLPYNVLSMGNLFNLASCFLAIGIVAEIRRWDMGLWPFVLGVGALLTGWLATIIKLAAAPDFIFLNLLVGGGVMLFANAYILLVSYQSTIARAQEALQKERVVLQAATTAKGEFLASLSHELRTPLNAIIGFAEAMADGAMGTLDELQQELVAEIRRGGERLLHLINRVLDFSKLEAGRMPLHVEITALAPFMEGVTRFHAQKAQDKGLSLVLDIQEGLDFWPLERRATEKALNELLDNAICFASQGEVRVSTVRNADNTLAIRIKDAGPGIAAACLLRLYQPFEQFSNDRERGTQGAGLGLALARAWTEAQGGSLVHEHNNQEGACFLLRLPADGALKYTMPDPKARVDVALQTPPRSLPLFAMALMATLAGIPGFLHNEIGARLLTAGIDVFGACCAVRAGRRPSFVLVGLGIALGGAMNALIALAMSLGWHELYQHRVMLFLVAASVFVGACATIGPRQRPRLALPILVMVVGASVQVLVLLHESAPSVMLYFLAASAGTILALGSMEYGLQGQGAPGRLVWMGGLLLYWLSAYLGCLRLDMPPETIASTMGFFTFYGYSMGLAGLGLFIESRRWDIGPWALILVVGSALLAWSMGTIVLRPFPQVLSYWVITGGCTIYLLALAILVAHHNRARHMTQALEQAHEEARRASADKTRFLTTMSHELRTPLNAVLGFADVLKSGDTGALEPEALEAITEIETAGEHLLSLVEDIMDLNQIEEGVVTLDLVPVDLPALLRNSLAIVKERAHRKGIHLELDLDPRIGSCLLDARKVKQLVFNLLSNAVKFTPDRGTVTLAAHLVSRTEVLAHQGKPGFNAQTLNDTQTFLALTVTDTGIGMAPQDLPRLFQRYSQLEAGRQQQGTGLGLSLVKAFAELHGGTVMVASEVGKGSSFGVWLGASEALP